MANHHVLIGLTLILVTQLHCTRAITVQEGGVSHEYNFEYELPPPNSKFLTEVLFDYHECAHRCRFRGMSVLQRFEQISYEAWEKLKAHLNDVRKIEEIVYPWQSKNPTQGETVDALIWLNRKRVLNAKQIDDRSDKTEFSHPGGVVYEKLLCLCHGLKKDIPESDAEGVKRKSKEAEKALKTAHFSYGSYMMLSLVVTSAVLLVGLIALNIVILVNDKKGRQSVTHNIFGDATMASVMQSIHAKPPKKEKKPKKSKK